MGLYGVHPDQRIQPFQRETRNIEALKKDYEIFAVGTLMDFLSRFTL